MPELDSLRGIACLLVLFYHGFANRYFPEQTNAAERAFVGVLKYGWTGVNLFFVLSGFLITGILLSTRSRPGYYRRFYIRRALRILPLYYAILVAVAVAWKLGLCDRHYDWFFFGMSSVYLANLTPLFGVPIQFTVLWSLAVEEHYYLLWPTVVRRSRTRGLVIVVLTLCLLAPILRFIAFRIGANVFGYYTWLVLDGLAMGSLLAIAVRQYQFARNVLWRIVMAAAIFSALCFLVERTRAIHFTGAALQVTCINSFYSSLLLAVVLLGSYSARRSRTLEFFGRISYGVYLLHMLFFDLFDTTARRHLPALAPGHLSFFFTVIRFAVVACVTVGCAWFSREYFEEPILRLKDRLASYGEAASRERPDPLQGSFVDEARAV